jgi:MoaA/NifB/PqqE/SkfB family radical SAM enzyme
LADCYRLEGISWVHFTGGEPTLWREGDRTLIDLLVEISSHGFTPGFTTNGSFFEDIGKCRELLTAYAENSTTPMRLCLSIDTFHRNFDPVSRRAKSLDNIVECIGDLSSSQADLFKIRVMAVISKDNASLLQKEMIRHYELLGVSFGFAALRLGGRARSFGHLCPDLSSDAAEGLGAYHQFHRRTSAVSHSHDTNVILADFINLIGEDYYFTSPWRNVGHLGDLPSELLEAYQGPNDGRCWPYE